MAWNPAPEVKVAREAAAKLGEIRKAGIANVVILYCTDDGQLGMASYGKTKELCQRAKWWGDKAYDCVMDAFRDYQG